MLHPSKRVCDACGALQWGKCSGCARSHRKSKPNLEEHTPISASEEELDMMSKHGIEWRSGLEDLYPDMPPLAPLCRACRAAARQIELELLESAYDAEKAADAAVVKAAVEAYDKKAAMMRDSDTGYDPDVPERISTMFGRVLVLLDDNGEFDIGIGHWGGPEARIKCLVLGNFSVDGEASSDDETVMTENSFNGHTEPYVARIRFPKFVINEVYRKGTFQAGDIQCIWRVPMRGDIYTKACVSTEHLDNVLNRIGTDTASLKQLIITGSDEDEDSDALVQQASLVEVTAPEAVSSSGNSWLRKLRKKLRNR